MSPLQPFPFSCVRGQRAKEPGFPEMVEGGEQARNGQILFLMPPCGYLSTSGSEARSLVLRKMHVLPQATQFPTNELPSLLFSPQAMMVLDQ